MTTPGSTTTGFEYAAPSVIPSVVLALIVVIAEPTCHTLCADGSPCTETKQHHPYGCEQDAHIKPL
jgi:hypothetical protein